MLSLPQERITLHEPRAGFLRVEDCVAAHAAAAAAAGATLETGVTVRGWRADGAGIVVETDRGRIAAERFVLAAGSWAGDLLRLPAVELTVLRKSMFWVRPPPGRQAAFAEGSLPCFAFATADGFFYGFPQLDPRGVKIAEHSDGSVVADPLAVDRTVDAGERDRIAAIVQRHLPSLGGDLTMPSACTRCPPTGTSWSGCTPPMIASPSPPGSPATASSSRA